MWILGYVSLDRFDADQKDFSFFITGPKKTPQLMWCDDFEQDIALYNRLCFLEMKPS